MKNKDLYSFHLQLLSLKDNILYHLCQSRINEFYKHNTVRINTLLEKIDALQIKYFVIDGDQVRKQENSELPVMLEGMLYEDFTKEYNELLDTPTIIKF